MKDTENVQVNDEIKIKIDHIGGSADYIREFRAFPRDASKTRSPADSRKDKPSTRRYRVRRRVILRTRCAHDAHVACDRAGLKALR